MIYEYVDTSFFSRSFKSIY